MKKHKKYTDFIGKTTSHFDYTFKQPIRCGLPTKATRVLMDVYAYEKLGQNFTKKELLRRVGTNTWKNSGTCSNLFGSAVRQGFIKRVKGKVYAGENLEDYLKLHNLI